MLMEGRVSLTCLDFFFWLQKDKDSERLYKWQHCCLTQEPLRKRIVCCELGRLYNKEAIIEKLLDKALAGTIRSVEHIKGLKVIRWNYF